jgi:hypothetical protein
VPKKSCLIHGEDSSHMTNVDKGWDWLHDAFPYRVDGVQKEEEWVVRKWNVWAKFNKIQTEKWKLLDRASAGGKALQKSIRQRWRPKAVARAINNKRKAVSDLDSDSEGW